MDFLANQLLSGTATLLFFFIFFLGVLAWVFRPGSTDKYKKWGQIPLEENGVNTSSSKGASEALKEKSND